MSLRDTVALFAATFQHLAPHQADCEFSYSLFRFLQPVQSTEDTYGSNSFAFVEYESRRDADDAYHEMHNRSISRSEVLKIEVRITIPTICWTSTTNPIAVGTHSSIRILALRLWR